MLHIGRATLYKEKCNEEWGLLFCWFFFYILLRAFFPSRWFFSKKHQRLKPTNFSIMPHLWSTKPFQMVALRWNSRLDHLPKRLLPIQLSIHLWASLDHKCLSVNLWKVLVYSALWGFKMRPKKPPTNQPKKTPNKPVPLNNGESKKRLTFLIFSWEVSSSWREKGSTGSGLFSQNLLD